MQQNKIFFPKLISHNLVGLMVDFTKLIILKNESIPPTKKHMENIATSVVYNHVKFKVLNVFRQEDIGIGNLTPYRDSFFNDMNSRNWRIQTVNNSPSVV